MTGMFIGWSKTLPALGELALSTKESQAVHVVPESELAKAHKKGFRSFLGACRELLFARKLDVPRLEEHSPDGGLSKPEVNALVAALTDALNADKGARATAVHLVLVEQTLVQEISGGLGAVPADVLKHAIPQLASLSRFRGCLELKLLLQRMQQIVETHAELSISDKECEINERSNPMVLRGPSPISSQARIEPSRRPSMESAENVVEDDGFPDTQAFSDDEVDMPLPRPPVDKAMVMGHGGR